MITIEVTYLPPPKRIAGRRLGWTGRAWKWTVWLRCGHVEQVPQRSLACWDTHLHCSTCKV